MASYQYHSLFIADCLAWPPMSRRAKPGTILLAFLPSGSGLGFNFHLKFVGYGFEDAA